jgi:effector-binding domain-containing protein
MAKPEMSGWFAGPHRITAPFSPLVRHAVRRFRHAVTILLYDRGMPVSVNVQTVHPRTLAAVRRVVAPRAVASAWGPAVGKVWEFIRSQPGLWTDGHNLFLYHHPKQPGAILCDFGVEVTRTFETAGEVYATETPGGEAAVAVHRGAYSRMSEAHNAIGNWMAANRRESAGHSWEIYGDPTPDPADTETTVVYLLK